MKIATIVIILVLALIFTIPATGKEYRLLGSFYYELLPRCYVWQPTGWTSLDSCFYVQGAEDIEIGPSTPPAMCHWEFKRVVVREKPLDDSLNRALLHYTGWDIQTFDADLYAEVWLKRKVCE